MKKIFLLLLACLASCTEPCPECDAGYRIIGIYGKRKHKENNWILDSIGGSFPSGDIRKLNLSFTLNQEATINQARILMITGIHGFLALINQDTKIRPYLNHYPFTSNDLAFALAFHSENGDFTSYASLIDGKIYYSCFDKSLRKLKGVYEESFEEAQKIVQQTESPTALIP